MKKLIIDLDENEPEITLEEVLRLIKEGFTSGIEPTWEIVEVEKTQEQIKELFCQLNLEEQRKLVDEIDGCITTEEAKHSEE